MMHLLIPATGIPPVVAQSRVLPGDDRSVSSIVIAGMLLAAAFLRWLVRMSAPDRHTAPGAAGSGDDRPTPPTSTPGPRHWRQIMASLRRSQGSVLATRRGAAVLTALAGLTLAAAMLFGAEVGLAIAVALTVPAGIAGCGGIARSQGRGEQIPPYLGMLAHSGRIITTAPSPKLAATLTGAAVDFGFDIACLLLLDEDDERFTVCGSVGLGDGVVGTTVYASEGLLGMEPAARLARRVIVADDYPASPFSNPHLVREIRSALAAPLSAGGRPIGVLAAAKRSAGVTSEEIQAFEVLALQGGLGFETVARRRAALEAAVL